MPEHNFEIVQTLLLRKGVEDLLLTKRTYPDQSHFYALSHLATGETCESAGVAWRTDKLTQQFNQFVTGHGGQIIPLPEGSFAESGTQFDTVIAAMTIHPPDLARRPARISLAEAL